jgi:hypothetical protein
LSPADRSVLAALSHGARPRETVAAGGLLSLGPNYVDMLRQAATYVDKILRVPSLATFP